MVSAAANDTKEFLAITYSWRTLTQLLHNIFLDTIYFHDMSTRGDVHQEVSSATIPISIKKKDNLTYLVFKQELEGPVAAPGVAILIVGRTQKIKHQHVTLINLSQF